MVMRGGRRPMFQPRIGKPREVWIGVEDDPAAIALAESSA